MSQTFDCVKHCGSSLGHLWRSNFVTLHYISACDQSSTWVLFLVCRLIGLIGSDWCGMWQWLCLLDHCMVNFVKPNLLGTRKEFCNRFVNPIMNGQCSDSSPYDVKLMKRRAHILHETLAGCVQVSCTGSLVVYSDVLDFNFLIWWAGFSRIYILGSNVDLGWFGRKLLHWRCWFSVI